MRQYSVIDEFGAPLNVEPILTYVHAWHFRRVCALETGLVLRITWTGETLGLRPVHMQWDEYCEVIVPEEVRNLHEESEF